MTMRIERDTGAGQIIETAPTGRTDRAEASTPLSIASPRPRVERSQRNLYLVISASSVLTAPVPGRSQWGRSLVRIACALIVCALAVGALTFGTLKFRAASFRSALWRVVQTCVVDYKLTGMAFPCLRVDVTGGEERGYVLIRAPFGSHDLIVAPTRKVVGVEDSWLQLPATPNYFVAAWRARSFLEGRGQNLADGDFALAVNSASTRTQDQLHIHLGCLLPVAKRALITFAPSLRIGEWSHVPSVIYDAEFWGLSLGRQGLLDVNAFRLAAEGPAGKDGDRSRLLIVVARLRIVDEEQWVLLASNLGGPGTYTQMSAEDILDPSCQRGVKH